MPIVKPFKAVRPKVEFAKKITSLPYDVISEKEAREELNKNPLTFFRIGRPEIHFPEGTDPYSEKIYQKGKETIQEFLEKKYFHQDEKEHFYIYREIKGNISQTGLVSLVSVEDYDQDLIKKHELTREEKEKDRVNHIVQTRAHAEPVFLAYPDHPELSFLIKTYIENHDCVYDFEDSQGVQNTLWIIEDAHIQFMIQSIFQSDIKALYIADGHHRAKASSLTAEILKKSNPNHTGNESYNYFMAVSFPSTQL
ncbi:MAG TPA: DUF1015 domain-containing protein, partial [Spirochaetia bacterium]|nr:DUF1015 domain-containing protein [Spirochaetia bacterium]